MWDRIRRYLADTPLNDPLERQQALLFQIMLIGMIGILIVAALLSLIAGLLFDGVASDRNLRSAVYNGLAALCCAIPLAALRRGWFVPAVLGIMAIFFLLAAFALASGGFYNGDLLLIVVPLILASLLLSWRARFLTFGLSLALLGGMALARRGSTPEIDAIAIVGNFILIGGLIMIFLDRFGSSLRQALDLAQTHQQAREREIAGRVQAGEQLRQSEARLLALMENASEAIWSVDRNYTLLVFNPVFYEQFVTAFGRPPAIGQRLPDIIPADMFWKDAYDRALGGERFSIEKEYPVEEGTRYLVISLNPIQSAEGVTGVALFARDITMHRSMEQALIESEERFRLIAENSSDLIDLLDDNGWRLYASPSYRTVLGYNPDDFLGMAGASLIHPDDLTSIAEQIQELAVSGHGRATYRIRHADGSWRWLETRASAIMQNGRRYAVAVGRDITERKRLEVQLMQAQRLESVGRLAGGIAHDFNNLLTAVLGNAELALDALPPASPVRADVAEIVRAAERASALTRQLLAFARKQIIEPHVIDLNRLILEMDTLLRRLIGEDIDLVTLPAPDLGSVKADPGQIEQVVVNLAVNARDAMPDGGKLTIETRNIVVGHDYAQQHVSITPGNYVMLAVSDTGVGMDESTLDRAFEPFFTTKEKARGTGLGLAMCYGIVKQHGGYIWAYSEPDQGSTFKIYLPYVDAQPEACPPAAAPSAMPRGTETILLVEDEPAVRTLASRALREQGYVVIEAPQGDVALSQVAAYAGGAIDLLLTDVVMPGMSGKLLSEAIQRQFPAIRVLYISGYTDNAIAHHGLLEPGVAFLPKPFSPATLARKVREVLDADCDD